MSSVCGDVSVKNDFLSVYSAPPCCDVPICTWRTSEHGCGHYVQEVLAWSGIARPSSKALSVRVVGPHSVAGATFGEGRRRG